LLIGYCKVYTRSQMKLSNERGCLKKEEYRKLIECKRKLMDLA